MVKIQKQGGIMTYFERRMVGEVVMVAERNGAQATFMVGVLDCSTDLQSFALQTVGGELLCAFRYDDIGGSIMTTG